MKSERTRRLSTLALGGVVLAGYFAFLVPRTSLVAAGPDASGYLNEARLFASGRLRVHVEILHTLGMGKQYTNVFTPLGFAPGVNGTIVPTYPPGLPLHMAIAGVSEGGVVHRSSSLRSLPLDVWRCCSCWHDQAAGDSEELRVGGCVPDVSTVGRARDAA